MQTLKRYRKSTSDLCVVMVGLLVLGAKAGLSGAYRGVIYWKDDRGKIHASHFLNNVIVIFGTVKNL